MLEHASYELDLLPSTDLLTLMATFRGILDRTLLENLYALVAEGRLPGTTAVTRKTTEEEVEG